MALYFEFRINKKRIPSDCFLAILPTGHGRALGRRCLDVATYVKNSKINSAAATFAGHFESVLEKKLPTISRSD